MEAWIHGVWFSFQKIVEESPYPFMVTDLEGRVIWMNDAFTDMCGYRLDELKGRKAGHVLQGKETCPQSVGRLRTAIEEGKSCAVELINYHKNGSSYRVEINLKPIFDDEGDLAFFFAVERDLTNPLDVSESNRVDMTLFGMN